MFRNSTCDENYLIITTIILISCGISDTEVETSSAYVKQTP
jgi:hypothetical protein